MKTQLISFVKSTMAIVPFLLMSFTVPKDLEHKSEVSSKCLLLNSESLEDLDETESLKIEEWMISDSYWESEDSAYELRVDVKIPEEELKIEAWMSDDNLWAGR